MTTPSTSTVSKSDPFQAYRKDKMSEKMGTAKVVSTGLDLIGDAISIPLNLAWQGRTLFCNLSDMTQASCALLDRVPSEIYRISKLKSTVDKVVQWHRDSLANQAALLSHEFDLPLNDATAYLHDCEHVLADIALTAAVGGLQKGIGGLSSIVGKAKPSQALVESTPSLTEGLVGPEWLYYGLEPDIQLRKSALMATLAKTDDHVLKYVKQYSQRFTKETDFSVDIKPNQPAAAALHLTTNIGYPRGHTWQILERIEDIARMGGADQIHLGAYFINEGLRNAFLKRYKLLGRVGTSGKVDVFEIPVRGAQKSQPLQKEISVEVKQHQDYIFKMGSKQEPHTAIAKFDYALYDSQSGGISRSVLRELQGRAQKLNATKLILELNPRIRNSYPKKFDQYERILSKRFPNVGKHRFEIPLQKAARVGENPIAKMSHFEPASTVRMPMMAPAMLALTADKSNPIRRNHEDKVRNPATYVQPHTRSSSQGLPQSLDDAALKVMRISEDLLNVVPAFNQGRELKDLIVTMIENPDNAPDMLLRQWGPVDLFQRAVDTPGKVTASIKAFQATPSAANLAGAVGAVLGAIAVANEVLPIANAVVHDIIPKGIRHPKKIPEKVGKLIVNLTLNKVLGVHQFVKDFMHHPLNAAANVFVGILKSPETLGRGIRDLITGNRKAKKKRARAIEAAKEKARQEMTKAVTLCCETANKYWMRDQSQSVDRYLSALFNDWKTGVNKKRIKLDFISFINKIKTEFASGHFLEARLLSPTAHRPTIPPQNSKAFQAPAMAVNALFLMANQQWMRDQTQPIDKYLIALFNDWQAGVDNRSISVDFVSFINLIKTNLELRLFLQAHLLSPSAHTKEPMVPAPIVRVFEAHDVAVERMKEEVVVLEKRIKEVAASKESIVSSTKDLTALTAVVTTATSEHKVINQALEQATQSYQEARKDLRSAQVQLGQAVNRFAATTDRFSAFVLANHDKIKTVIKQQVK